MGKRTKKGETKEETTLTRLAIVNHDRCKPKKCRQECRRGCPVNKTGKHCIEVKSTDKIAEISEQFCIGCGICVKRCPFDAISIINLPKNLEKDTTHRYGPNSFKLHRLPLPRSGKVLGLVGTNGIGKSTALKILAGKEKPNLGKFKNPPTWEEILKYFKGSELQGYFTKMLENKMKALIKPQYVDDIPRAAKGYVGKMINAKDERNVKDELIQQLQLSKVLNRKINELSGGELQRFAIAIVSCCFANIYMFDEPSSYLDVSQRLNAARVIRSLVKNDNYIIVVEHDLAILDYLSDYICCLYGVPGGYGVVTMPFGVREGINIFLAGFVPTENLKFRNEALTFKVSENIEDVHHKNSEIRTRYKYPKMTKSYITKTSSFKLNISKGEFNDSEIIVLLGENGTGKTTFIRMLAGKLKPDEEDVIIPNLCVSYKPQKISPKFPGTVLELLMKRIRNAYINPQFQTDVFKPMNIKVLLDRKVQNLSGGELQRVALVLALGTPADVYLIDEPSAYLDSEQRLIAAKVIKRFILHTKRTAFIVEHDFIMATYLADRVIVYDGNPSVQCNANTPQTLLSGMNKFLKSLDITFRRDPTNYRPRINKLGSIKDKEQKEKGTYFFMDSVEEDQPDNKKKSKKSKKSSK